MEQKEFKLVATNIDWFSNKEGLPSKVEIPANFWSESSENTYKTDFGYFLSVAIGHNVNDFSIQFNFTKEEIEERIAFLEKSIEKSFEDAEIRALEDQKESLEVALHIYEAEQSRIMDDVCLEIYKLLREGLTPNEAFHKIGLLEEGNDITESESKIVSSWFQLNEFVDSIRTKEQYEEHKDLNEMEK